ncbi:leucyl/phenylalanyl-tRNA--protein transferase [Alphaproteobacteria bacterium HT1-32]|nr:leucyl/phenylalanyl-tRNA--protein transferase [Alphaproteobacteria bacterium HT1-32]
MSQLTAEILLRAYAAGIFPMAETSDDPTLYWVDPDMRGILPLDSFHLPKKLRRVIRRGDFRVTCDQAFEDVMRLCAEPTEDRPDTWINEEIVRLYSDLFAINCAHSIECWNGTDLVGGLYGVSLGSAFFGESMFSRQTNASKVALAHLVARLRAGGYSLLDTQFVTNHLARFGVIEIPRRNYLKMLGDAMERRASFPRELTNPLDYLRQLEPDAPSAG